MPDAEYLDLEYMDWKSGGDTNFAPIATADGELDCRGFWNKGDERPDKDAMLHVERGAVPDDRDLRRERRRQLRPRAHDQARAAGPRRPRSAASTATTTTASIPPTDGWVVRAWLELTDNPDSYMLADGHRARRAARPRHRGPRARCTAAARFVVDTQRLWHVVVHNGTAPRYALITSFESGPALDRWIAANSRHR